MALIVLPINNTDTRARVACQRTGVWRALSRVRAHTNPHSYDRADLFTCIVLYVYKLCNENPPAAASDAVAVAVLEVKTLTHARERSFVSSTTAAPGLMNIERTCAILRQHRNGSAGTRQLCCDCIEEADIAYFPPHNIHMPMYDQFNYGNFIRNQSNVMLLMYVVHALFTVRQTQSTHTHVVRPTNRYEHAKDIVLIRLSKN